jgi:hypothetical protein
LLVVVAVGFFLASILLVVLVVMTRTADLPAPTATVMFVTATSGAQAATVTPFVPPPTVLPTDAPTVTPPLPTPVGEVKVGDFVQVAGTGEAGTLNLRAEPGIGKPVNYVALEREVFQVQAGPSDADGFVWWYLVDPVSGTRFGWAVQNYLQVVQGQ